MRTTQVKLISLPKTKRRILEIQVHTHINRTFICPNEMH